MNRQYPVISHLHFYGHKIPIDSILRAVDPHSGKTRKNRDRRRLKDSAQRVNIGRIVAASKKGALYENG